jgi:alpha-L-fucosidase
MDTIALQRLKEIGTWMKTNGEAIYGSRMYSSFSKG